MAKNFDDLVSVIAEAVGDARQVDAYKLSQVVSCSSSEACQALAKCGYTWYAPLLFRRDND